MKGKLRILSAGALLSVAAAAGASPIFTLTGGTSIPEPGNDFQWITGTVTEGAALGVSEPGILTIEYIGKEAGFVATEFWFGSLVAPGGLLIATTNTGLPIIEGQTSALPFPTPAIPRGLAPYETEIAEGIVPFHFRVPGNSGAVVGNGDAPGPDGSPFIAIWWPAGSGPLADVAYVLLDDGGGFNPGDPSDRDHDDMILRLTVRAIPEPGTWQTVAGGLTVLGALRRGTSARRVRQRRRAAG
jgi:hypothetical protein